MPKGTKRRFTPRMRTVIDHVSVAIESVEPLHHGGRWRYEVAATANHGALSYYEVYPSKTKARNKAVRILMYPYQTWPSD